MYTYKYTGLNTGKSYTMNKAFHVCVSVWAWIHFEDSGLKGSAPKHMLRSILQC